MFHTKAKRYNFAIQKNKKRNKYKILYIIKTQNKQNTIQIDTNTLI